MMKPGASISVGFAEMRVKDSTAAPKDHGVVELLIGGLHVPPAEFERYIRVYDMERMESAIRNALARLFDVSLRQDQTTNVQIVRDAQQILALAGGGRITRESD